MRRFALPLLLLALVGCHSQQRVIGDIRAKTVAVLFRDEDGHQRIGCAGVWISKSAFLTAAHCATFDRSIMMDTLFEYATHAQLAEAGVDDSGPIKIRARLAIKVAQSTAQDIAMLRVDEDGEPPHPCATIDTRALVVGERVHVVGHTIGMPYTWTPGWVSGNRRMIGPDEVRGRFVQLWSGAYTGNSGGGVWSEDGKLVGLMSFLGKAPGFAVPGVVLDQFVRKVGKL